MSRNYDLVTEDGTYMPHSTNNLGLGFLGKIMQVLAVTASKFCKHFMPTTGKITCAF